MAESETGLYKRYLKTSKSSPYGYFKGNVNTSFEMILEDIKDGALMLNGLTNGLYSMVDLAKIYYDKGYYVLVIRYPSHGTYPGETLKLKEFSETAKFGSKMAGKKLE